LCAFLLTTDDPMNFLRCWNEGNFEACRREWPEAPDEVYPAPFFEQDDREMKEEAAIWKLIHKHARDLHAVDYWSGSCKDSNKLHKAYESGDALSKALKDAIRR
jgi:hypothetical protein